MAVVQLYLQLFLFWLNEAKWQRISACPRCLNKQKGNIYVFMTKRKKWRNKNHFGLPDNETCSFQMIFSNEDEYRQWKTQLYLLTASFNLNKWIYDWFVVEMIEDGGRRILEHRIV